MSTFSQWIRAVMAGALMVSAMAQAAPITQVWNNPNPDADFGLFDTLAFRFVSQTPAQSGFNNVIIQPLNGWVSLGFDPLLTYAQGNEGNLIQFSLVFDGAATDHVEWEVWYYRDHEVLGGGRYVGDVGRTAFSFVMLDEDLAPAAIPEPGALVLSASALLAAGVVGRRRRRELVQD